MAKFRVNEKVVRNSDNKVGVIKAREVIGNGKTTDVKYLVDFGEGMENWKIVTRKDISKLSLDEKFPYLIETYDVGDGKILTMVANVTTEKEYELVSFDDFFVTKKTKTLKIGFSIYNGVDKFDARIGEKIAIHRCKKNPFTTMISSFSGEFNSDTVKAIMRIKADYIIKNIDNFYRPK